MNLKFGFCSLIRRLELVFKNSNWEWSTPSRFNSHHQLLKNQFFLLHQGQRIQIQVILRLLSLNYVWYYFPSTVYVFNQIALWKCWFYLYNRSEFNFRYTSFKRWITPTSLHFCKIIYAWMSWKYFNYPSWLNYFLYLNTKEQRITSSNTDNISVFTRFAQRTHK